MRRTLGIAALLLIAGWMGCGTAGTKVLAVDAEGPPAQAAAGAASRATVASSQSGFDYYVLALSWSPQHCSTPAGRRDAVQCAGPKRFGFIVHGLWPQYEKGWPQDCATRYSLSETVVRGVLDIMPSRGLIRHEWSKHGTCSGLKPEDYFAAARKAFEQFRAPAGYGTPDTQTNVSPAKYESAWLAANPGLNASGVAVVCSGRFLQEVRICLDKNLKPRACGSDVRDRCRVPEMIVRPLR